MQPVAEHAPAPTAIAMMTVFMLKLLQLVAEA